MSSYGSTASGQRIVEDVTKGVAPVLARRTAAAGRGGRRMVTGDAINARRIIGKAEVDKGLGKTVRRLTGRVKVVEPPKKASNEISPGIFYLGASQPGMRGSQSVIGKGSFSIPASQVARGGKAGVRQLRGAGREIETSVWNKPKPRVAQMSFAKAGGMGLLSGLRNAGRAARDPKAAFSGLKGGFNSGRAGGTASSLSGPLSAKGFGTSLGVAAGRNPVRTGAIAGATGTAAVLGGNGRRNNSQGGYTPSLYAPPTPFGKKLTPEQNARAKANAAARGVRRGAYDNMRAAGKPMGDPVGKRSYDPEGERRFRQGAAATATGAGGLGMLAAGGRQVRNDSKALRGLPAMKERFEPPEPAEVDPKTKLAREPQVLEEMRVKRSSAQRHNSNAKVVNGLRGKKGYLVRGRSAGLAAGGLGLLGASGALVRNRNEERWN